MTFQRQPTKAELRHIVLNIWRVLIDFDTLKEVDDTKQFYDDVIATIQGDMTMNCFTSTWICDEIDDLDFGIAYDTIKYLLKKKILTKI